MEISRNKTGELAFFLIYSCLVYQSMNETYDLKDVISSMCDVPFEDCDIYLKEIVVKAIAHENEIVEDIKKYLINWRYERISLISQAILLFGYSNYKYCHNVDKATAINSAVKFSKKYGDKDEYKFINAVLDKAL